MPPPKDIPPWDMLDGIEAAGTPTARPGIFAIVWRWRYELGSSAVVTGSAIAIDVTAGTTGLITAAATMAASAVAALWWPPSRRSIVARVRCVVVQHRVRAGLASAWVQTRSGKLPVIVRTVPRPFGERMLLLCRAGTTPRDLVAAREILRVACWAADARVTYDERRPHLVTIDIIRVSYAGELAARERPRGDTDGPYEGDETDSEPLSRGRVAIARHMRTVAATATAEPLWRGAR
jgi:hypothetical protein